MNNLKLHFLLDPTITFLNFGSFGACPKPVFETYQKIQRQLEFEPVQFIVFDGIEALKEARVSLGNYLNCHADDVVYVTNPSYGINTIAKSFPLKNGDEILSTNLEYGAMDRTWNYYCEKAGAKYVRQNIRLPIQNKETFLEEFWSGCSPKTKAIFISHITSATGLILPIEEICQEAKARGLMTIIDGAHVPAHLPLDLSTLDPDIYVGACHKWMMAPKGSSFLYVKKEQQHWVDPLLVSWGYQSDFPSHSQFLDYHQTNGTRDFSAFLAVPSAIEFMEQNDWWAVAKSCRELTLQNAQRFCNLVDQEPICPLTNEYIGQMFSIPIKTDKPMQLYKELFNRFKIEMPVAHQNGNLYLRYSIQAYNSSEDLNKLEEAIRTIRKEGKFLK